MALFVALAVIERRHEFATMAAVGATLRSVGAFVWSEAALVLVAGAGCSPPGSGSLLALMLVAMLQHVFDPPPDALTVPWAYLGELAGAAVVATGVAVCDRRPAAAPPTARTATARAVGRGEGVGW